MIFLLWFFEYFGGITKCLEIFQSSTKQIEYYESILFLNYVIWIVISLIAEAIYAFIKNVNVKGDYSTNGVINKAIALLGIASIIFTGLVSSYYYGFTI